MRIIHWVLVSCICATVCAAAAGEPDKQSSDRQEVEELAAKLVSDNWEVRLDAIGRLQDLGNVAKIALPRLIKRLEDPILAVRITAASIICKFGPDAKDAIDALIRGLKDKDATSTYGYFAEALGRIGPDAKNAVGTLTEMIVSERSRNRESSESNVFQGARALGNIGAYEKTVIDVLTELKADDRARIREAAESALAKIEDAKKKATDLDRKR